MMITNKSTKELQCYENRRGKKIFMNAHRLHKEGISKTQISKILNIRKPTIIKWLSQDNYNENRGWYKGHARKYTDTKIANRICALKRKRIENRSYFVGSNYVQMDYAKQYSCVNLPSIWFIDKTIRHVGLQTKKPKTHKKGGSQYLLYPIQLIKNLGYIQQSADFIGKKYISGQSDPINIFSTSYYAPFKLYQIKPVKAERAVYVIENLTALWQKYPVLNVLRVDNGLQFRGTARGKRSLGPFLKFLLNLGVTPLFGSPSKPWTNPHIEGHNRVFNEKVWGRNFFTHRDQIAVECERFNRESLEYFHFKYSRLVFNGSFNYIENDQDIETDNLKSTAGKKIYFIRFVQSTEKGKNAYTTILNEEVSLPEQYNHQFVFAEWNIDKEQLAIYSG
jgi:predicted transcriptional regulator